MNFLHLLWLIPLLAIGLFVLCVGYATASAQLRHRRYLAGGIDLVDEMTQEQFGRYLTGYFEHDGYTVTPLFQDEASGATLLVCRDSEKRFVFAKRSRRGVPDTEVAHALNTADDVKATGRLIVTNCVLFRDMDQKVKKQEVTVWDREKLMPLMGKAKARKFALQAITEE